MSIPRFYENLYRELERLKLYSDPKQRDEVIDSAPELSESEKEALKSGDPILISVAARQTTWTSGFILSEQKSGWP